MKCEVEAFRSLVVHLAMTTWLMREKEVAVWKVVRFSGSHSHRVDFSRWHGREERTVAKPVRS